MHVVQRPGDMLLVLVLVLVFAGSASGLAEEVTESRAAPSPPPPVPGTEAAVAPDDATTEPPKTAPESASAAECIEPQLYDDASTDGAGKATGEPDPESVVDAAGEASGKVDPLGGAAGKANQRQSESASRNDCEAPAVELAQPTLDLEALEGRLRDTGAIGFFTKLELKGQIDDLLEDFRGFHNARSELSLDALRARFNLLMLKVLSLLQDDDPELSAEIALARPGLWTVLSDPAKFAQVILTQG